jgi:hypothetical protein
MSDNRLTESKHSLYPVSTSSWPTVQALRILPPLHLVFHSNQYWQGQGNRNVGQAVDREQTYLVGHTPTARPSLPSSFTYALETSDALKDSCNSHNGHWGPHR